MGLTEGFCIVFFYLWALSWVRRGFSEAGLGAACARVEALIGTSLLCSVTMGPSSCHHEPQPPPRPEEAVTPTCYHIRQKPPLPPVQTWMEQGPGLFQSEISSIFLDASAEGLDAH